MATESCLENKFPGLTFEQHKAQTDAEGGDPNTERIARLMKSRKGQHVNFDEPARGYSTKNSSGGFGGGGRDKFADEVTNKQQLS